MLAAYQKHVNPVLAQLEDMAGISRRFVRSDGCYLWDDEGKRYGRHAKLTDHKLRRVKLKIGGKKGATFYSPWNKKNTTHLYSFQITGIKENYYGPSSKFPFFKKYNKVVYGSFK